MKKYHAAHLSVLLLLCLCAVLAAPCAAAEDEALLSGEGSAEGVLQAGGLLLPTGEGLPLLGSAQDDFEALLLQKIQAWNGEAEMTADISGLNISGNDLDSLMSRFTNSHPELFYLHGGYGYSYYSDGRVSNITLSFDTSYSSDDVLAFNSAAAAALSGVDMAWSDEQKALYLHDYIVTHCEYDLSYSKFNAYNVLVDHSAVCQGYSLAYRYLASQAGLDCEVITSNALNHAWNAVTVDGTRYYVDCTWDDPVFSETTTFYAAYCKHENFLRSRAGIASTGHNSTDWLDESGGNAYSGISAGTKYDSAYWSDCTTAIPHAGSLWAYADSGTGAVYVHDYALSGSGRLLYTVADNWNVWNGGGYFYTTKYAHLASDGASFYVSCPQRILRLSTDGTAAECYTLSSAEQAKGYIYGIRAEGGYLIYDLYTSYDSGSYVQSGRLALDTTYTVAFDPNGGSGTMPAQAMAADTATALDANAFTRSGYTFTGWNTEPDGSGTAYKDGAAVTLRDDMTLYAQWEEAEPAINGIAYAGKTFTLSITAPAGKSATIVLASYTAEGRMLACAVKTDASDGANTMELDTEGAACVKAFLLDSDAYSPLCGEAAKEIT